MHGRQGTGINQHILSVGNGGGGGGVHSVWLVVSAISTGIM